ncbi:erd-2.2 [Symbiodinium natans]|uniref:Erd-2.2 protein n=1 Tax=Symbiodinium natans TaxID=878477 RepID=A0A812UR84_9DINO|nr:erd-2.2 [Symbiodinium natans]
MSVEVHQRVNYWYLQFKTGISRSTQILYCLVFVTRYLDLLDKTQAFYLVFFKITYIVTSIIVLAVFYKLDSTYERQKDTCSLAAILVPCSISAVLLAETYQAVDILWTFSQFCEGFAMVPQYVFCYRDRLAKDVGVTFYVLSMGAYRCFYAANWIYKKAPYDIHTTYVVSLMAMPATPADASRDVTVLGLLLRAS